MELFVIHGIGVAQFGYRLGAQAVASTLAALTGICAIDLQVLGETAGVIWHMGARYADRWGRYPAWRETKHRHGRRQA
ncbi:hypothetical protein PoB_002186600 [Plakobranchus ocellatus]|uniref:Uncharacterized protein n=1 Tax=Plakobranchus ocellatus TaxID=259542 RepID=A0AAV3Z7R1_9GAST|nr:hypothetical protein PoB_002186600 [Plakobranchus ocellatus]